jgi:hypothetical protein
MDFLHKKIKMALENTGWKLLCKVRKRRGMDLKAGQIRQDRGWADRTRPENHASQSLCSSLHLILDNLGSSSFTNFVLMMSRIRVGQPVGDDFITCFFTNLDQFDSRRGDQTEPGQRDENRNYEDHCSLSQFHFYFLSKIILFIV